MRGPVDVAQELLATEILHEIVHLPRRVDTVAELPEVLGLPGGACVAVRMYDTGTALVAAIVPADRIPASAAVAAAADARTARPAQADRVSAVTDCHPGLVSPVGLPQDVVVLTDLAVSEQDVVYTATGDGSTALKIRTLDLLKITGARLAPLVER